MTNASDRLRSALLEHEARTGQKPTQAAAAVKMKQSTLSMALGRGTLPKDYPALARHLGVNPFWVKDGTLPRYISEQAQSVSFKAATVEFTELQKLDWRGSMTDEELAALPRLFRVPMPDNAMAPKAREGWMVAFERADTAAAGKRVLVRTRQGNVFCRRYTEPDSSGRWVAKPDNTDYQQFGSDEHGLQVIARMLYVETPDEE